MSALSDFLEILESGGKIHICINDVSGILQSGELKIDFTNKIHAMPFCYACKSTASGYNSCQRCKNIANKIAVKKNRAFSGYCCAGFYDAVYPVEYGGSVYCVVYAGALVKGRADFEVRAKRFARRNGIPQTMLLDFYEESDCAQSAEILLKAARVTAEYIKGIALNNGYFESTRKNSYALIIKNVCEYIEKNYSEQLILKEIAKLYFINEKYLGRLFRQNTGRSFNEYLSDVRLATAKKMLKSCEKTVSQISEECGYSSVTYFNRCFLNKYNTTPTKYRRSL